MRRQITLLLITLLISGFAASASKPDFAFPAQVSKTARRDLKAAIKANDGPATVRAVMDYALAETAIEPDSTAAVAREISSLTARVNDPATRALILLLQADVTNSTTWADSALTFTPALREQPVERWKSVVEADATYLPTLYDFAVSQVLTHGHAQADSLYRAVCDFHHDDPAPLTYWSLQRGTTWSTGVDLLRRYFTDRAAAVYAMQWLGARVGSQRQTRELYTLACEWLAANHSDSYVEGLIRRLTVPQLRVNVPAVCVPDSAARVTVNSDNATEASLAVYRTKPSRQLLRTVQLHFPGEGVFSADTTVSILLDGYGEYSIVPLLPGNTATAEAINNGAKVAVTSMLLQTERYGSSAATVMALDAITGAPIDGVNFSESNGRVHAAKDADRYTPNVWKGYNTSSASTVPRWASSANILTDRAIYHPGDTLRFAATVYKYSTGTKRELLAGEHVTVKLFNANSKLVNTRELTSDSLGRVSGEFALPSTGLTGRFRVQVEGMGQTFVTVSEYKAPTYEVTCTASRQPDGTVTVNGAAMTYSGFPVIDAQVVVEMRRLSPRAWWASYSVMADETLDAVTVRTDASGTYSADFKAPVDAPLAAFVTVTSPSGESHEGSAFIPAKPYFISANFPENLQAPTSAAWQPPVRVLDAQGAEVTLPLVYLLDGKDAVTDWSKIPSGRYSLTIVPEDAALADTVRVSSVAIYRSKDVMPPYQSALWVPDSRVETGKELLVGTSWSGEHIRYTLWTPDTILEQKWITPRAGIERIKMQLPDGVNDATLTLWTLRDCQFHSCTVSVTRPKVPRSLRLAVSSLRDRVTAGDRELWTISVTDNLDRPVPAAVMLDVYSKALDALEPLYWGFYAQSLGGKGYWALNRAPGSGYAFTQGTWPNLNGVSVTSRFDTYGRGWPREMVYNLTERKLYMSAARATGAVATADMAAEGAMEEDAAVAMDNGAIAGGGESQQQEQYRMPETPVALWNPLLTTGPDGETQVQFVAPNANTTWSVKALAYDRDLLIGTFGADIIASKPLMVQTALPRFMRTGDVLPLRASLMNATDSTVVVRSTMELFNPLDGRVIDSHEFTDTLAPNASTVLEWPYTAGEYPAVGVRVRSTAGLFTDAEQALLPILPAQVRVMDTRVITIPADSLHTRIDVPAGSVVELTANAAWECVKALPGLLDVQSRSALTATSALFSACVADGLLRQHPEIGVGLHRWAADDSALVSNLMKNEDLKLALLTDTPWVNAVESDSERMARLLLLFDRRETASVIDRSVNTLASLVRDGGLTWTADSDKPSEWITGEVLTALGQLKRLGYLPERNKQLQDLITNAVKYMDRTVAADFAKYPQRNYSSYAAMRLLFPEIQQSTAATRVSTAAVQHLVSHWRDLSLEGKAQAALVLNASGYPSTARQIIESLRQYRAWKQTGVTPTVLTAFATIEPAAAEVDEIRQWLIGQKRSQQWGTAMRTSAVIAAILGSGSSWLVPADNQMAITVDDKPFSPAGMEAVSGELRIDLPQGGVVEMAKGRFPAWGAVYTVTESRADSVDTSAPSAPLVIRRTVTGNMTVGSKVTVTLELEAAQPMDYVTVLSPRAAAFEPVEQLPQRLWGAYREPLNTRTAWFINRLPKGCTILTEEFYVTAPGTFLLAPAEAQSQYAPEFSAHTPGQQIDAF